MTPRRDTPARRGAHRIRADIGTGHFDFNAQGCNFTVHWFGAWKAIMMRAVNFDFDGVLVDSLPAHLRYCRRIAQDFRLPIEIPPPDEFKDRVIRTGMVISPMVHFFRAVGFPDED